jgi:hypothetical protein
MDTLRSIGTSADELKQKIFDLGSLAKETSYHFQGLVHVFHLYSSCS